MRNGQASVLIIIAIGVLRFSDRFHRPWDLVVGALAIALFGFALGMIMRQARAAKQQRADDRSSAG